MHTADVNLSSVSQQGLYNISLSGLYSHVKCRVIILSKQDQQIKMRFSNLICC